MQLLEKWMNPAQAGLVGLDVGSGAVKLVGLRQGASGWAATCAAWADIIGDDNTPQDEAILKAVRHCLETAGGLSMRYAVCGLSGPDASVRGFSFPAMPDEAVEQAVGFEAQQVCPLDMHKSALDYQLMQTGAVDGNAPKPQSGVLVAGTEQAIQYRCKLVKDAGGRVALMDSDGLAALNCLGALEDLDGCRTVAMVDIGRRLTNIILLGPNGLPFVRDIDSGSETLLTKISQITGQAADTVSAALGSCDNEATSGQLLSALHQAARPLVMSINETLKFYATQEKTPVAERVYLCGGGALIRPLVELLGDALPMAVTVFDPFETIRVDGQLDGGDLLQTRGPAFVVAAGLAMRTV